MFLFFKKLICQRSTRTKELKVKMLQDYNTLMEKGISNFVIKLINITIIMI